MIDDDAIASRLFGGTATQPSPAPRAAHDNDDEAVASRLFGSTRAQTGRAPGADQASRLFGNTMRSSPPAPANSTEQHEPRTNQELQAALYKEPAAPAHLVPVPDEVQAIRSAPDRRLFSAQDLLKDAIRDTEFKGADLAPEVAQHAVAELREVAADLGLGKNEILALKGQAAAYRAQPVPVEQQVDDSIAALNREFGTGAKQALLDARALVARDPRVGRMVELLSLGNDPQTVVLLAKQARAQIAAGTLKRKRDAP